MAALLAGAGACSISEHIYGTAASRAPYPSLATIPANAPADPKTPQQVAEIRSTLDTLKDDHSETALKQIESSGR